MDTRARAILKIGDEMFSNKGRVDSLWQEIALNFYPSRADFTEKRNDGQEYSDHLFTSYPILARRELGNLISANLRDQSKKWVSIHVHDETLDKGDRERAFLEYMTDIHWRGLYDPGARLIKATKETDHDFVTFGNGVIHGTPNIRGDGPLYKAYHLRDNVWSENSEGVVDNNHRNWDPTARQLKMLFPKKVSKNVEKAFEKEPEKKFNCRHVLVPSRIYEPDSKNGKRFPFTSLYVERETETVLEEVGVNFFQYVIPRWEVVSGSPFGRSMATDIALPDSRTMQVVVRTLREAGEKFVDPPLIAIADAIRNDISTYAGGITVAEMEYDEKLGEVLRPLSQDRGGMPIGFEIAEALREDIRNGFLLDKIQLPQAGKDMTAFEVRRRIEEHIRASAPINEPIEQEYNTPLCELNFNILREGGAFPLDEMPETLSGKDLRYEFRSPLSDLAEQNEAEVYLDVMNRILVPAASIDPAQLENVDMTESTRDAMRSAGWKAEWFKDKEAVEQKRDEIAKAQQMQQGMEAMDRLGQVAEQGGNASKAINEAE